MRIGYSCCMVASMLLTSRRMHPIRSAKLLKSLRSHQLSAAAAVNSGRKSPRPVSPAIRRPPSNFTGRSTGMEYRSPRALLGKKNSSTISVPHASMRRLIAHIGYGWKDDTFDFASEVNVDCLSVTTPPATTGSRQAGRQSVTKA